MYDNTRNEEHLGTLYLFVLCNKRTDPKNLGNTPNIFLVVSSWYSVNTTNRDKVSTSVTPNVSLVERVKYVNTVKPRCPKLEYWLSEKRVLRISHPQFSQWR